MADSLRDQKAMALAEQVTEAARRRRDGKDGETKVIVERDDAAIKAIQDQLLKLKAEQSKPANDQEIIPAAIGDLHKEVHSVGELFDSFRKEVANQLADLHRRMQTLEDRPIDITPTEPAELQDNINELGRELANMSASILQHIATLQKRLDACESRFTDLPQVLHDLQTQRRATR